MGTFGSAFGAGLHYVKNVKKEEFLEEPVMSEGVFSNVL